MLVCTFPAIQSRTCKVGDFKLETSKEQWFCSISSSRCQKSECAEAFAGARMQ